jgi:hypothetical protein
LKAEFSDNPDDLHQHKCVLDNFYLEVRAQLNKNVKNPLDPATFDFPQFLLTILLGKREEEEMMGLSIYQP